MLHFCEQNVNSLVFGHIFCILALFCCKLCLQQCFLEVTSKKCGLKPYRVLLNTAVLAIRCKLLGVRLLLCLHSARAKKGMSPLALRLYFLLSARFNAALGWVFSAEDGFLEKISKNQMKPIDSHANL